MRQDVAGKAMVPINTAGGTTDDVLTFDFYETPYGIMKRRTYRNGMWTLLTGGSPTTAFHP